MLKSLFSFVGTCTWFEYLRNMLIILACLLLFLVLGRFLRGGISVIFPWFALAMLAINVANTVRRLRTLNRSVYLAALLLIPVVNALFTIVMIFMPPKAVQHVQHQQPQQRQHSQHPQQRAATGTTLPANR